MAHLARITIYPLKSGDGQDVSSARVLPSGALEHDRRWALRRGDGSFVNGKQTPAIHRLRSRVDLESETFEWLNEPAARYELRQPSAEFLERCRELAGGEVTLLEDRAAGFPDDTVSPGPTVVAADTLAEVASWFAPLSVEDVWRRFRPNLAVAGVEAFWEDRLYGEAGGLVEFRVGEVHFVGVNPCQRCPVPPRDARTGAEWPGFQKTFATRRRATLPAWAPTGRFDHYYRLSTNTRLKAGSAGGVVRLGDAVEIVGPVAAE